MLWSNNAVNDLIRAALAPIQKELKKMNELIALLQPLASVVPALKTKMDNLAQENGSLKAQVAALTDQVTALTAAAQTPVPADPATLAPIAAAMQELTALAQ